MKVQSKAIMRAARGKPCTLRISSLYPGLSCSPESTTVGAHLPGCGGGGMSTKETDMAVVFACFNCHEILDGRNSMASEFVAIKYPSAMEHQQKRALVETHKMLIEEGIITVTDGVLT